jgi:peptidoglycan/LPS O-acetylase OafA/YrhL
VTPPVSKSEARGREAWLDALRGIAALAVVFDHLTQATLRGTRPYVYEWIEPGRYGVYVFFLISGYIVPASLEHKGSIRAFWISRLFRLYPMYLVAMALVLVLGSVGQVSLRGAGQDPVNSVFAQFLMMGDVLDGPNVPNVVWSLTYEMTFYLLLTALFAAGIHKCSGWYAIGFAVSAIAVGGVLPRLYLSGHVAGPAVVSAVCDLLIIGGLAGAIALRGPARLAAAWLAAGLALLLVAINGHPGFPYLFEVPVILSLMFTGTVLYRATQGQYTWLKAIALAATAAGLCVAAALLHMRTAGMGAGTARYLERRWVISFGSAFGTFAIGLACRHWRLPKVLTWLGLISYSIYLLHPMLVEVMYNEVIAGHAYPYWLQYLIAVATVLVLIAAASLTYLLVERPAQRLARRLTARHLTAAVSPPAASPAHLIKPRD